MSAAGRIRVRLTRSVIGFDRRQRATVKGLGLRKIGHTVELEDTPSVRGMINAVRHLVAVVED